MASSRSRSSVLASLRLSWNTSHYPASLTSSSRSAPASNNSQLLRMKLMIKRGIVAARPHFTRKNLRRSSHSHSCCFRIKRNSNIVLSRIRRQDYPTWDFSSFPWLKTNFTIDMCSLGAPSRGILITLPQRLPRVKYLKNSMLNLMSMLLNSNHRYNLPFMQHNDLHQWPQRTQIQFWRSNLSKIKAIAHHRFTKVKITLVNLK